LGGQNFFALHFLIIDIMNKNLVIGAQEQKEKFRE
jgi:hypothetical protein